ncbi:acyl-CoA Delta-9 desaturase-like [Spodoptera frugiperda]|uniref:Acyl-CoA Delta-9 desaturase-like n=1 Tax=Spodoptera frugiperda TaxID=7108 RepID=A0A9R0EGW3_SPOFR|nr:acyl-CoA Delta-9 desaturase-like [Spodoptera frugiperda]
MTIQSNSLEFGSTENGSKQDGKVNSLPAHPKKWDIVWRELIIFTIFHITAVRGLYLFITVAKWQTCIFAFLLYIATTTSVTVGAHRLWSHKAFQAKLPLKVILLFFFTMAFQYSAVIWARLHRMHHKYLDTDADPHNAGRGFFFSHIGWMLIKKHPEYRAHKVDISDLMQDPLLRFQHKHYWEVLFIAFFLIPTYVPTLWGEQSSTAFYTCVCLRYVCGLHSIWLVNSAAHMWGTKPYDKNIRAVETKIVSMLAAGEGFHNYHHTFPWDYRIAEFGDYSLNLGKLFIDTMAKIGWAYNLKSVPDELIEKRVKRTGDGTHPVWGWDDPDLPLEDKRMSIVK